MSERRQVPGPGHTQERQASRYRGQQEAVTGGRGGGPRARQERGDGEEAEAARHAAGDTRGLLAGTSRHSSWTI